MRRICDICGGSIHDAKQAQRYCLACSVAVQKVKGKQAARVGYRLRKIVWDEMSDEKKARLIEEAAKKALENEDEVLFKKLEERRKARIEREFDKKSQKGREENEG